MEGLEGARIPIRPDGGAGRRVSVVLSASRELTIGDVYVKGGFTSPRAIARAHKEECISKPIANPSRISIK